MYCPDYEGKDLIDPVPGYVDGYLSKEELDNVRAQYAGEVTVVDKWVGVFLEEARRMGYFDNSLIIYTTDHGEPFGEHGIVRKARPWPYEEQSHIPWILHHPDGIGHGKCIDAFIETCDMMPTILDFLGLKGPEDMHGQSILPLVAGDVEKLRDYAYSCWHGRSWSIRDRDWSYLLWLNADDRDPACPELYDRRGDPYEQRNRIAEHPEVGEKLELELRRFVAGLT